MDQLSNPGFLPSDWQAIYGDRSVVRMYMDLLKDGVPMFFGAPNERIDSDRASILETIIEGDSWHLASSFKMQRYSKAIEERANLLLEVGELEFWY